MEQKHTPGPWATTTTDDGIVVTSTHDANGLDDDVALIYGGNDNDDGVREANARLIAAAPDMLAALEDNIDLLLGMLDYFEDDSHERLMIQRQINANRAAIDKARGS